AYINRGDLLRDQNDWAGARNAYEQAIRLRPKEASGYLGLGYVLVHLKDFAEAEAAAQQALAVQGNSNVDRAAVQILLGLIRSEQKDFAGAIVAYEKARAFIPRSAAVYYVLGSNRLKLRNLSGALADLRKAVNLDPQYPNAHAALGMALYELRDLQA